MNRARVIDAIVVSGASRVVGGYGDDVYLAEVSGQVRQETGFQGESLLRETLPVVEEILVSDLMIVGNVVPTSPPQGALGVPLAEFVPWELTIPEALARIEREWRALGRDPSLGDICWFRNTSNGDERASRSGLL